ncbi:hypothetical protein Daus18300_008599 [Diaporthe australafricana]|uniref:VOC domain-containing protein n=1 Tax=Diaporthe australafricana TaxID=127596 RepID=A0ABR3WHB7_9PEZI
MSEQSTALIYGPPRSMPLLIAINLDVKCARSTHELLSDVFAETQMIPPMLSSDGKTATLRLMNSIIRFRGCKSVSDSLGGYKIQFDVYVKDLEHVKKVLKQNDIKYENLGKGGESQHSIARIVQFLDKDGYSWRVGELRPL